MNHQCTHGEKVSNVLGFLSPISGQQVCSSIIRDIKDVAGNIAGEAIKLKGQFGGAPLQVTPGAAKPPESASISHLTLELIRSKLDLSGRATTTLATIIRQTTKVKIDPNYILEMVKKNHLLDGYFVSMILPFEEDKEDVDKKIVVAGQNKVEELIVYACKKRNIGEEEHILIKFGADAGGDFFKLMMSIERPKKVRGDFDSPEKKLVKALEEFKDGGVKRLFILGIGYKIKENYCNVKKFMDLLGISVLDGTFAVDLKMLNILLGKPTKPKRKCLKCFPPAAPAS